MEDIKAFRRYYNDHLHSKLVAFETRRWLLLIMIALGSVGLIVLTVVVISLGMAALLLFLPIPFWVFYEVMKRQIRVYKKAFKPLVVQAILDFIDPRLKYYPEQYVPYDTFNRSNIFPVEPSVYLGEDYIIGKIGEVSFEMCELHIQHPSYIKARLEKLFEGVFFHAKFNYSSKGRIIIIPRQRWQRFIKTMKNITRYGGYEIKETGNPVFDKEFLVYADPKVNYKEVLTAGLLNTINNYHLEYKKEIYASFVDSHFYMAIAEPYQLLDAHVFTSNLDFELIAAYYRELYVFTKLVEDFDIMH
jgi:hypothetical protein